MLSFAMGVHIKGVDHQSHTTGEGGDSVMLVAKDGKGVKMVVFAPSTIKRHGWRCIHLVRDLIVCSSKVKPHGNIRASEETNTLGLAWKTLT
jgi:hypothetical protein